MTHRVVKSFTKGLAPMARRQTGLYRWWAVPEHVTMAHAMVPSSRTPNRVLILSAAAAVVAAMLLLLATGLAGGGRGGGTFAGDMRYLYIAGEMWERHQSPYIASDFIAMMKSVANIVSINYAYPPSSAPLALALSLGTQLYADVLIAILNIAALMWVAYFIVKANGIARSEASEPGAAIRDPLVLLAIAVAIGNPFASHVVWMGQTTLISAGLLLIAWLSAHDDRDIAAGIFLALGAFKPQLALLIGLWFLLDRRWLLLVTAAGVTLLLSGWPVATTRITGSWLAWLSSLSDYQGAIYNVIAFKHVFGVRSLIAAFGGTVPSLLPLAIGATVLLYAQRGRYASIWLIGPIFAISALLIYAHDYDLAALSVMTLPLLIACRHSPAAVVTLAVLAFFLFVPQRLWEYVDLDALARSREIALIGVLALYAVMCRRPAIAPARAAAFAG